MQDNELIASFEPKLAGYVLVLAFDDLEEMLLEQERIQANHRLDRDKHGNPLSQVETLWMGQSQSGTRRLMSDQIDTLLLVASVAGRAEVENARKEWARQRMQASSMLAVSAGISEMWHPSVEQMDMLEKWAEECLELNPAGREGWSPRIKTHVAREGFNWFCMDHDRPDLRFEGSGGGRAFTGVLKSMFPNEIAVLRDNGNNPYIHGLRRKTGINPKYFKRD